MADKDNTRDEFVFEDEVNQEEPEYTKESYEGSTENIKSLLHNKRLMMLGGAVIGLWIITFLFDSMMPKDSIEEDLESLTVSSEPVTTPVDNGPKNSADYDKFQDMVNSNADGVEKINANIQQQNSSIEKAHQNFNMLNSKVNKMANDISDIHYQFNSILEIERELFQKIAKIEDKMKKEEEAAKKKLEVKKVVKPLKTYFIRAVVEGRAWLVDAEGHSITVSVGNSLTDYGKVEKIYSSQGFIVTSSGRVIQFPSD